MINFKIASYIALAPSSDQAVEDLLDAGIIHLSNDILVVIISGGNL